MEGAGAGPGAGAGGEPAAPGPDRACYLAGQALAAVLADPRRDAGAGAGAAGGRGGGDALAGALGALWGGAGDRGAAAAGAGAAWAAEPPPPRDPVRLPDVEPQDLARYLGAVGAPWEGFSRARRRMEVRRGRAEGGAGAPAAARGDVLVGCMREVPEVFFREDFALSEPRTFEAVCPGGGAAGPGPGAGDGGGEACRAAALGALSQYVDTTEVHLLQEVQLRSEALLGAAGDLHDLQGMLERARAKAQALRALVRGTDADTLRTSRAVQRGLRRKKNLVRLLSVLESVGRMEAARADLLPLQEEGNYGRILEAVTFIRGATGGRDSLGGLDCLRNVPREAARAVVGAIGLMRGALEEAFSAAGPNATLLVLGQLVREQPDLGGDMAAVARLWDLVLDAFPEDAGAAPVELRERLGPPAAGLMECGELLPSLEACQGRVATAVKAAFREAVDEMLGVLREARAASPGTASAAAPGTTAGGPAASAGPPLGEALAALSVGEFAVVLATALAAALGQLHHARQAAQELEAYAARVRSPKGAAAGAPADCPEPAEAVTEACTAVVQQGAEAAARRWVRLLQARAEVHAGLTLGEFVPVVRSSRLFAERLEGLHVRVPASVRAAVNGQGKAFLDKMHMKLRAQVQAVLDVEVWEPLEVPAGLQAVATSIFPGEAPPPGPPGGGGVDAPPTSHLHIGRHRVLAVSSVLALVQVMGQYLLFLKSVPELASEAAHRVLDALRLFNARSCDMVLGGRAVEVAGIRAVSLSHLGHAHQAVLASSLLVPGLVAHFQAALPRLHQQIVLPQFQRFAADLEKHRAGIQGRMVEKMNERLMANMAALVGLSETWGQARGGIAAGTGAGSTFQPSQFARTVSKQVSGFQEVLIAVLREDELQAVSCGLVNAFCVPLAERVQGLPCGADRLLWQRQMNADLGAVVACLRALTRGVELESLHRVEDLIVGADTLARLEQMRSPHARGSDGIAALRQQYAPEPPGGAAQGADENHESQGRGPASPGESDQGDSAEAGAAGSAPAAAALGRGDPLADLPLESSSAPASAAAAK